MLIWTTISEEGWHSRGNRCSYLITVKAGEFALTCACNECVVAYFDTLGAAQQIAEDWDETLATQA
jgi:hypothetical protein